MFCCCPTALWAVKHGRVADTVRRLSRGPATKRQYGLTPWLWTAPMSDPSRMPAPIVDIQNRTLWTLLGVNVRELEKLWRVFVNVDRDRSGEIDLTEFLDFLRIPRTRFNKRAFKIFDGDGSGEIDFAEFCCALVTYCSFDKRSLQLACHHVTRCV